MGNRIHTLTLNTKGAASKLALGAASLMLLTVVSSATIAGATPLKDSNKDKDATSLEKDNNKENEKNDQNQRDKPHHANQRDKEHHSNNGNHGYGGGSGYGGGNKNSIKTNLTNNQSGNNNVFSVVYNFFFG